MVKVMELKKKPMKTKKIGMKKKPKKTKRRTV